MEQLKKEKIYIVPDTKITWVLRRDKLNVIVPRNNDDIINMPNFWGMCNWRDILSHHTLYASWNLQKVNWSKFNRMNSYLSTL